MVVLSRVVFNLMVANSLTPTRITQNKRKSKYKLKTSFIIIEFAVIQSPTPDSPFTSVKYLARGQLTVTQRGKEG